MKIPLLQKGNTSRKANVFSSLCSDFTDDVPRLNVHALAGALHDGAASHWAWADTTVTMRAEPARLVLTIGGRDMVVPIEWIPGTTGGEWPLFRCPRCDRRRGHLYLAGAGDAIVCRVCLRLVYCTTHSKSPAPWLARRLRRKLGPGPRPSRGGRAAVWYDRLATAASVNEVRALAGLTAEIEREKVRHERQQQCRRDTDAGGS